jgi:hypothetical protein
MSITENYSALCKYRATHGMRVADGSVSTYIKSKQTLKRVKEFISSLPENELRPILRRNLCCDLEELLNHHKLDLISPSHSGADAYEILKYIKLI